MDVDEPAKPFPTIMLNQVGYDLLQLNAVQRIIGLLFAHKLNFSLFDFLFAQPDPRTNNKTYHIGSVLSIVAMAIFSGHRNISQIQRFGNTQSNILHFVLILDLCYPYYFVVNNAFGVSL
ncbi:MAG: hypothetical protein PF904_09855 [Kiritimatiellae bacterium]|nr:hypothetical protein [Kiritimatiellia bacterium]